MNRTTKFSPEVRKRAVYMVFVQCGEHPSQWSAIEAIAPKIGSTSQTLLNWVRHHERDTGQRSMATPEHQRIKARSARGRSCDAPTRS